MTTSPLRPLRRLLVANRGEIAVRVIRAARELGIETVAVSSADDAGSAHTRLADQAVALAGDGPAPYLDIAALIAVAEQTGADSLHPGYGFLSERAALATACATAGVVFVGPTPETLDRFGDKAAARVLAQACGMPTVPGTDGPIDVDGATAFFGAQPAGATIVLKAVSGGGGRGMRVITEPGEVADAFARASSEATTAFGSGELYAERYLPEVRHVEVQIVGDGTGLVSALGDRDCSLQRRHQKVVEIAPAPGLDAGLRTALAEAAVALGAVVRYRGVGTVEFLVTPAGEWFFIEANARLQVEHTVTEAVTGVDLVHTQLRIAGGASLAELYLTPPEVPAPRGYAVQARVTLASTGEITDLVLPSGPGIRVDTFAEPGLVTSARFDPLLAKVIAHVPRGNHAAALARADGAIAELRIDGVSTNAAELRAILTHPDVIAGTVHTRWLDDSSFWLDERAPEPAVVEPERGFHVAAPLQGTVVAVATEVGAAVHEGAQLVVMEAMKMEHVIVAPRSGIVVAITAPVGSAVAAGTVLLTLAPAEVEGVAATAATTPDPDHIRPDLAELRARQGRTTDDARPDAVARRHDRGHRTARENVVDLCDPGSFVEYAPLVVAGQRRRRSMEDLIAKTPGDGLVGGIGHVNGRPTVVVSYDYTVLAGTQGIQNHRKKDRLFELTEQLRLPLVVFAEGGGGRPGDTDGIGTGLDCMAFRLFAELSGLVPLVGITNGFCFAGNAALLGCCDVVIATEGSNIGMGGPAMIEGGGLGVFAPTDVGPLDVQVPNGVVDLAVADEAEAVAVAKQYLSYFQGDSPEWECADQRLLRHLIPENRLRIYDIRQVIETLADTGSVLELRRAFGVGMVTALARVEGRAVGIVANNPAHLAGAVDSDGADKASRFLQLCDAHDLPVLFLMDTPGIMVGPEVEKTALVRHACRMFVTGASMTVPTMTVVLRKGYGLGAQTMAAGSFKAPLFCVSWPTGEFGGMGLEGAVKLGYRNELAAIEDPEERQRMYEEMVAKMYEHGKALSFATNFEIDDVIDPADSRRWISMGLAAAPRPAPRTHKKRPCIDTW